MQVTITVACTLDCPIITVHAGKCYKAYTAIRPMMALGMTALNLQIAEFKFTHNFVICNRLPDTEIILA